MFRRLMMFSAAATVVACASQSGEVKQTETKQKLVNVSAFDLSNCFSSELEVPKVANEAVLTGLWLNAQPRLTECFVDPAHRGPAKDTTATVKLTLDENGLKHEITAQNLTPEGQKCLEGVLEHAVKAEALPKGHKVVTIEQKLENQVGRDAAVQMGVSEISDVAGTIRLAVPQWCECYAPWKEAAPHAFKAALTLHKAGGAANDIKIPATNDAVADGVGACVQGKLAALTLPVKSDTVNLPGLPILFLNTTLDKDLSADQAGPLRVAQLDGLRAQKTAAAAIAAGSAANASQNYAALVNKYKANQKSVTPKELKDKCELLLKADDAYLKNLAAQVDIDQRTLALATSLKAEDAQWAALEAAAQKQVEASQKDNVKAKGIRQSDAAACPKMHY